MLTYFQVLGTCILLFVIHCSTETSAHTTHRLQCTQCSPPGNIANCDGITTCSGEEICYTQLTEVSGFLLSPSTKRYESGCILKDKCNVVGTSLLQPQGLFDFRTFVCGGCCNGTECNKYLCDMNEKVATTKPQVGTSTQHHLQCGDCSMSAPSNCHETVTCSDGELCYAQSTKSSDALLLLDPTISYNSGCIKAEKCHDVETTPLEAPHFIFTNELLCGGCCNTTKCNNFMCDIHNTVTATVPPPKSTAQLQHTAQRPHTHEVILTSPVPSTTKTTSTTSSTKTTTHLATTKEATTHAVFATCEVCHGPGCDSGSVWMSRCPQHSPLCMTTVVNHQHGNKVYTKSCASEPECDQKWLKESTGKSECVGFRPNTTYTFNFTCHYCCVTDGCNKDIIPQTNTLYMGHL